MFRLATDANSVSLIGMIACLGAATIANALGKRFRALGIHPAAAAMGQMTATAIMALPLAIMIDAPWRLGAVSAEVWACMAGLAVLSTALAMSSFSASWPPREQPTFPW